MTKAKLGFSSCLRSREKLSAQLDQIWLWLLRLVDRELAGRVSVVLDEYFSNLFAHGRKTMLAEIKATCCLSVLQQKKAWSVQVLFLDNGVKFNCLQLHAAQPEHFGLQLIQGLTADVNYSHNDGLNRLAATFSDDEKGKKDGG